MTHGSCLCNEVKYAFTGEPAKQVLCHCLPCRKISGSAFTTNIVVPTTAFTVTSGKSCLKSFSLLHPSGMTLTIFFCTECGTKIYKTGDADAFAGTVIIQAGTLNTEGLDGMKLEDVKIGAELWVKNRVGWLEGREGTAQCQEFV